MSVKKKRCGRCKKDLPVSEYYKSARKGLQSYCKACGLESVKQHQQSVGRSILNRARNYGLAKEEVVQFLAIPCCQACRRPFETEFQMKFDHCHTGGHFRGVLCHSCNQACQGTSLAAAERLRKCIDYLVRDEERMREKV
jgi:hypothetical protein